jgi:hypothetical protein
VSALGEFVDSGGEVGVEVEDWLEDWPICDMHLEVVTNFTP